MNTLDINVELPRKAKIEHAMSELKRNKTRPEGIVVEVLLAYKEITTEILSCYLTGFGKKRRSQRTGRRPIL